MNLINWLSNLLFKRRRIKDRLKLIEAMQEVNHPNCLCSIVVDNLIEQEEELTKC